MITLIIVGVIQLRKDNMAIKPRKGGNCGFDPRWRYQRSERYIKFAAEGRKATTLRQPL